MNKYTVELPPSLAATDDTNVETGITGTRWIGKKIGTFGEKGNFAAGDPLVYEDSIVTDLTNTALDKIVTLKFSSFTDNIEGGIQIPLSALEFSKDVTILGIQPIGRGFLVGNTSMGIFMGRIIHEGVKYAVADGNLLLTIDSSLALQLANSTLNIIIYYR